VLKLLAFVLPLGLDSFAVAAAIGASQVTTIWQRLRISLIFVLFEGGMPLIGLALGAMLARGIGQVADYVAGAAVIAIGAWMLLASDEDEEEKASRLLVAFKALENRKGSKDRQQNHNYNRGGEAY